MQQVKIKDKENDIIHGGILIDNGDVICGCCGGLIPKDEIGEDQSHEIIEIYPYWISLDKTIIG